MKRVARELVMKEISGDPEDDNMNAKGPKYYRTCRKLCWAKMRASR